MPISPRALLSIALPFAGLSLAVAQTVPPLDPATRAAINVQTTARPDLRNVCAPQPRLQEDVIDSRATPLPVDCARILGNAPAAPAAGPSLTEGIAPFQVEARSAAGSWRPLGRFGSRDAAAAAAREACVAPAPAGQSRVRATRVLAQAPAAPEQWDCRTERSR